MDGFTISYGTGNFEGGGGGLLVTNGGDITSSNCIFSNDGSSHNLRVLDEGGAIYLNAAGNNANILDCSFADSSPYGATYGGAIGINASGTVNIENSNFTNNLAETAGGALEISNNVGPVNILDCMFDDNTAADSGAIDINNSTVNITNCVFVANTAFGTFEFPVTVYSGTGGAISANNCDLTIASSTFTYNYADSLTTFGAPTGSSGAAVYISHGATVQITNSILYGDSARAG